MKTVHLIGGRKIIVLALTAFVVFSSVYARQAVAGELDVYGTASHWLWKEFGPNNERLLEESGWVPGIGFSCDTKFESQIIFRQRTELFRGRIDYDGQTQSGVPVTTTTDYLGIDVRGELGVERNLTDPWLIEPFTGLGIRAWQRDINNGVTATGGAVQGYTERWRTVHVLLGMRTTIRQSAIMRFYGEAGAKIPLYNENYVYLSDIGAGSNVSLEPGKQVSYFAEIGVKYRRLRAGLFYEDFRFPRSDNVQGSQNFYYYQPKSSLELVGLNVGVIF